MVNNGFEIPVASLRDYICSELGEEFLSKRNFNVFLTVIFVVITLCMGFSFVTNYQLSIVFFALGLVSVTMMSITAVKAISLGCRYIDIKDGKYMVMPCVCTRVVPIHTETEGVYIGLKLAHASNSAVEFDKVFKVRIPMFGKSKTYTGANVWLVRTHSGKEYVVMR